MIAQGLLGRITRARAPRRTARRAPRASARIWLPGRRVLALLVVVLALLGGLWLWLRDSSLVAVDKVTVTGVTGPDASRIRAALRTAARNMTTLDVDTGALHTAVAPYPVVKALRVSTQFPHGMRINVIAEDPIGEVMVAGRKVAVAGDGTLLRDAPATGQLPMIPLRAAPGGPRLSDSSDLEIVALLAAAPYQMLSQVTEATNSSRGLVAQLRNGPSIYFGDAGRLRAKWIAAGAVLASSTSAGAQYIDVTDPGRPAAGASASAAAAGAAAPSAAAATAVPSGSGAGSGQG